MKTSSLWKVAVVVLSALVIGFLDLPADIQTKYLPNLPASISNMEVNLGLDLKGGSRLDYKIDLSKATEQDHEGIKNSIMETMISRANESGVSEPNIYFEEIAGEDHIIVELAGVNIEEAKEKIGKVVLLEFKEEKTELDENEKSIVDQKIAEFIKKAQANPEKFSEYAAEEETRDPAKVVYFKENPNYVFKSSLSEKYYDYIDTLKPGEFVPQAIELEPFYDITEEGMLVQRQGTSIFKLVDRKKADFADYAARYSDVETAFEDKGKLPNDLGKEKYGEDFSEKVKALANSGNGSISPDPIETAFGYHIVFINNVSEENGEKKIEASHILLNYKDAQDKPDTERSKEVAESFSREIIERVKTGETVYKIERLFFSTAPYPWKDTSLNSKNFKRADVKIDPQTQQIFIGINFDEEGGKLFEELTEKNIGKKIGIFVGGNLVSQPVVNTKISGTSAVIEGYTDIKAAQALANDLNTGALAAPITLVGQNTISASLGSEALKTSLQAGIIGLILLAIFMVIYYRMLGVIAVIALALYSALILFLIKVALPIPAAIGISVVVFVVLLYKVINSDDSGWEKLISFIVATFVLFLFAQILSTPVTLTLAGVAGVILSIGIAVDANVLIFERMKEEFKEGRSLNSSIETGFARAWSSIRDSNFSTLITCVILMWFGSAVIQGFAFNLAMGVLVSMFSAITITKTLLKAFVGTKIGKINFLFCAETTKKKFHFPFIKTRKLWYAISSILIVLTFIVAGKYGVNLGRDFTGGALMEIKVEKQDTTLDEISGLITETEQEINSERGASSGSISLTSEASSFGAPNVIKSNEDSFIIRIKSISEEEHQKILEKLKSNLGNVEEVRFSTIGPVIGSTMKEKASEALLVAAVMIVLYIAFAFRHVPKAINPWRFGITTIIAVLHDLIIVTGLYLIASQFVALEIDLLFVTAMLTILGYSVNDTIVVFDRIRENIKRMSKANFDEVLDASLNQTIARSINTSFSTLLPLIALFVLGAESIRWFVFTLILGTVIGTYSSIFIASALLSSWKKLSEKE